MKRLVYLIIDQLAGHWEEVVRIEGTDLPPTNVKGYHERSLIPNFSHLIDSGRWEEVYIVIASDHGYHLGYSVAAGMGVKTNNWSCGIFRGSKSTGGYSGGPRRITFILSGGTLDKKYRGKTIEEAEIIDVIPTIAELLEVPYKCRGKSILW